MLVENKECKNVKLDEKLLEEIGNQIVKNHSIKNETPVDPEPLEVLFPQEAGAVNAVLSLTSTAIDHDTKKPVKLTKKIPINNTSNWISVVYKNPKNSVYIEMQVLLNGKIILKKLFYNKSTARIPAVWIKKYPKANYGYDIGYIRWLNFYAYSPKIQAAIWEKIKKDPKVKKQDIGFIKDYQKYFANRINLTFTYPNGKIERTDVLAYANGFDPNDYPTCKDKGRTDFEFIQSFAIATTKISDTIIKNWAAQKNKYPIGYLKAIYGSFMSALLVIKTSDMIADQTAKQLGITWKRTRITGVMNGITHGGGYIHVPANGMGMEKTGDSLQIKTFNYTCSAMLSILEDFNLNSMAFPANSVLLGTALHMLKTGKTATLQEKEGQLEIQLPKRPEVKIQIDPTTWLVKDIIWAYKGSIAAVPAYCYHNRQTNLINDLANQILNHKCDWLGFIGGLAISLGAAIIRILKTNGVPIKDPKMILGELVAGLGILAQYYDNQLDKGIDAKNFAIFAFNVGLSILPFFAKAGPTVGELIVSYIGNTGIKREVVHISAKFEGYVLSTMMLRPGGVFIGGRVIEPIYVANVQYIKYGTVQSVLKTAYGKTPTEAAINLVRDEAVGKGFEVLVNNYNPDNDIYTAKYYKNVDEYIKNP
jgi:hypothetical protein